MPGRGVRLITALTLAIGLASCGPVRQTRWTLVPPASAAGRSCVAGCRLAETHCRDGLNADCLAKTRRSNARYLGCVDESGGDDHAGLCVAHLAEHCSSPDYDACQSTYRDCFRVCGGAVTIRGECVALCE